MFKKKQSAPKKRSDAPQQRKRSPMPSAMFGVYDVGDDMMGDRSDDDPNLEAELNQILGGGKKKGPPQKPKKQLMDWSELDAQISASLRDDVDDDDDEVDLDETGDLEAELEGIVSDEEDGSLAPPAPTNRRSPSPQPQAASSGPVQVLEDRKKNYEMAIQNAQEKGEGSKVRRYKRGLDTINAMLKKAKAGKPINDEEIPCQVATGKPPPAAESTASDAALSAAAPSVPTSLPKPQPVAMQVEQPKPKIIEPKPEIKVDSALVDELTKRHQQFKVAAVAAKRSGNKEEALKFFKCIKLYDAAMTAAKEGRPVDLLQMPQPPTQQVTPVAPAATRSPAQPKEEPVSQAPAPPQTSTGVPAPKTMLEGLIQRQQKYQSTADQAKADGNGSKSRRMTRIVKQYDDAIKMCKLGKPFDVTELPVPMGYPPLPGMNEKQQDISDVLQQAANINVERDNTDIPKPQVAMAAHAAAAASPAPRPKPSPNTLSKPAQPARTPSPTPKHSAYQQQLDFLLNRKTAFKEAALVAKRKGDKETAMDLLKKMKGFDPMIEQARNGLKIDITKVPMPPMIRDEDASIPNDVTFEILDGGKHHEDDADIFKTLLEKLHEQVKKARGYSDQFTHSGDVSGANMFDQLARESQTDYDFVKNLKRHGDLPPRYYYDTKTFQSVHIIPELNSTDFELIIVQLLDLDAKDVKPSIEWEMPFPNDSPHKGKTEEARGIGNYKYDAQVRVPINRKSRSFQRAIRSKAIKLEVIQKGGFLRSDKSLGSAQIKLASLETSCEIHAVEPLKEGRAVVGRVEVKVRMRTPLVSSESKTTSEKWLLVRHEHVQRRAVPQPSSRSQAPPAKPRAEVTGSQRKDYKHPKIQGSIEVLALEKRAVEAKIKSFQSKGERPPVSVLQNQQSVQSKLNITSKFVKEGGADAMKYYVQYLKTEMENLKKEAQNFVKRGNHDQAKISLQKRKMIEGELQRIAPSTYI